MLRGSNWEKGAWLSADWCKGKRGYRRVGALKQNLDLAVGQSDTVPGNQPSPTGETRWDLREQLGMSAQGKGVWKVPVCDRFCLFQCSFFFVLHSEELCLLLEQMTQSILHLHTHTFITTYRCLVQLRLLQLHHLEHTASGAGKRETRVTLGLFMPPLESDAGDTTHVSLARTGHWGLKK